MAHASEENGRVDRFYERVMFPILDLPRAHRVAFGGRVIGAGEPEVPELLRTRRCSSKSHNVLYGHRPGQRRAWRLPRTQAIVVEGYTDVIALHEAGVTNAVATLGTALTARHVRAARQARVAKTIVYLFDGDAAGQKAADRASEFIDWRSAVESRTSDPIDLRVVVLPDNKDPMEYVSANGAQGMREVLAGSVPLLQFSIERCLGKYDLRKPAQKVRAMEERAADLVPHQGFRVRDRLRQPHRRPFECGVYCRS